mmetsp:Transcript_11106/g.12716  ORF Transcript_11106/g.12716 Transcript_11106/m.12716 type:complete len:334 (+) Transcript_11106:60-1061(+)|eukprot:CAMPEP_0184017124 /NCGR_PEP_ID=MMETSP0954-20121128/7335_1 /TAXON_ID=627963 /ORGANISM="Aplanochytrium sp, Strain PBS07" /LENGTH=333 /DNA_ID=CAMNT_0026298271 /DNA_START=97 /DNA_END=1098 /DNA_ORIENTATION=-
MEEVLRIRVKHGAKAKGEPDAKKRKLDFRKVNLKDLLAPYGEVDQYKLNTPFSAFVKFVNPDSITKAKLGLNNKKFGDFMLQVDIRKKDTFLKKEKLDKFGPKNVNRGEGFEKIKGLVLVENFVDEKVEDSLIDYFKNSDSAWEKPQESTKENESEIPSQPTRRRVQHYGFKFDYITRRGDTDNPLDNWPPLIDSLRPRINSEVSKALGKGISWISDQGTVNEYVTGEGIAKHIDTHSAFEDGIASLSVGSDSVFRFAPGEDENDDRAIEVLIPRRSLFIMTGDSRYYFTHQMPQRKSDKIDSKIVYRGTRYSITLRQIKYTACNCNYKSLCE